jgi:hypothetical protein
MALGRKNSPGDRHKITNASEVSAIYQLQKMEEDIDEIRRYITNEATGSAVTSIKNVNAGDLPTNSKGLSSGTLFNASGIIRIA